MAKRKLTLKQRIGLAGIEAEKMIEASKQFGYQEEIDKHCEQNPAFHKFYDRKGYEQRKENLKPYFIQ